MSACICRRLNERKGVEKIYSKGEKKKEIRADLIGDVGTGSLGGGPTRVGLLIIDWLGHKVGFLYLALSWS